MKSAVLRMFVLFVIFLAVPLSSAAHFIVGYVNDALDGADANDRTIVLWNPAEGVDDNITDTIGVNGNSGVANVYMIDCELLDGGCDIDDEMRVEVFDGGDNYVTGFENLSVTGAGYDVMDNLTLNSPPNVTFVVVDDSSGPPGFPENEIDLIAASARSVECIGIVKDLDADSIQDASAEFYYSTSFYGDSDDNNTHYTNDSCYINESYGDATETEVVCEFDVQYYANAGSWGCFLRVEDNVSAYSNRTDYTSINSLLSVGVSSSADFGILNTSEVSPENEINVTNYGNVMINLSLSGYAYWEDDDVGMNCSSGGNISLEYEKFNLTSSTAGILSLSEFEDNYVNLTGEPTTREFNLNFRQDDGDLYEAVNTTYWRIYVPAGIKEGCSGNIVFGAVQGGEG